MSPRTALLLAAVAAAAVLTASAFAVTAGSSVRGNPTRGKALFVRAGVFCASCHTLKAARSTGRDGPNLDKSKPSYARIVRKYVLRGVHPLSAKAQADIWLQVKTAKERREGKKDGA